MFIKIKILLLSVLALTGDVLGNRNENPCAGVTDAVSFRNDWSSCADYFWCNFDTAVPSGPCPEGMGFTLERVACSAAAAICEECPAEGNLAVADPEDFECTSYYFCMGGVRTTQRIVCADGLRFNRVSGMCDLFAHVSCRRADFPEEPVVPECPEGKNGDVNSDISCASFTQCVDGQKDGTFECENNLHFNPDTNSCDLPENLDPPCIDEGLPGIPAKNVPRVPNLGPESEPHQSFRERLLTKMHLH